MTDLAEDCAELLYFTFHRHCSLSPDAPIQAGHSLGPTRSVETWSLLPLSLNVPLVPVCPCPGKAAWAASCALLGALCYLRRAYSVFSLALRPSSANSISSTTSSNHSGCAPEAPVPPAAGDLASRLSSDEGEMDGADESEKLDCQFSTHHPRPLAVGHRASPSMHFPCASWACR